MLSLVSIKKYAPYTTIHAATERPGSVGRALTGVVRLCDENGDEVPRGTEGQIFSEPTEIMAPFEYHNDPAKTAEARNKHGWSGPPIWARRALHWPTSCWPGWPRSCHG